MYIYIYITYIYIYLNTVIYYYRSSYLAFDNLVPYMGVYIDADLYLRVDSTVLFIKLLCMSLSTYVVCI